MENLIQQLKDNEKPFGLMSEKMQEKAKAIGKDGFKALSTTHMSDTVWDGAVISHQDFYSGITYRLRSKYEDEPEKIEVRIIRGDGYISPVSTSSISAHVKEFEGKKWVSVVALNEAVKSIANAEYWLKKLNVWGNSDTVQKIYKLVHPKWDKDEEKPGIVECEIHPRPTDSTMVGYSIRSGEWIALQLAFRDPDFIGFKFDGYSDLFNEAVMYEWNGKLYREVQPDWVLSGKAKVLHATHVVFRRNKP